MSFDPFSLPVIAPLGLLVAGLGLYLNYRNNHGWKPTIVVVDRARFGPQPTALVLIFEVWNRYKYPIVIKEVDVRFERFSFIDPPKNESDDGSVEWLLEENRTFESYHSIRLEYNAHHRLYLLAPYNAESDDDKPEYARVAVRYFDSIKNKELTVKSNRIGL